MQLKLVEDEPQCLVIRSEGRITHELLQQQPVSLANQFGQAVYGRQVALDLSGSDYMDSSGVGFFLDQHKKFRTAGGKLVLFAVPPMVDKVLRMLQLGKVLHLATDLPAARNLLNGTQP